jgi:hypothetical protein
MMCGLWRLSSMGLTKTALNHNPNLYSRYRQACHVLNYMFRQMISALPKELNDWSGGAFLEVAEPRSAE